MKFSLVINADSEEGFVKAIADEMESRGLVVVAPGRTRPFDAKELCAETGLSDTQVRRMAEPGGVFERVPGTSAFRVTVASVRRWQGFNDQKKKVS